MRHSDVAYGRRRSGRGLRVVALPLIALFANLSLPTQAALPEHAARDWSASSDTLAARFSAVEEFRPVKGNAALKVHLDEMRLNRQAEKARAVDLFPEGDIPPPPDAVPAGRTGRWWAMNRGGAAEADGAILRAFQAAAQERFAGAPPVRTGLVSDGKLNAIQIAYAPYKPQEIVWSPATYLSAPNMRKDDHAWMARPLPAQVYSTREQQCLATGIYFEARGESAKGQAAVAQVILNRVRNPAYPDTICGVVYQNAKQYKRCQFSFACDGVKDRIRQPGAYKRAETIAMSVTSGETFLSEVGSATHYYASYVRPGWARSMIKMASIGDHHFFRTKRGGWR